MSNILSATERFLRDENGATAVEYALLAALIAAVIVAAVSTLGVSVNGLFEDFSTKAAAAGM